MIPYFRKIRKKLAENNRPMKYMRYAIGEIILVVIGILIAIQINNWNQERIQSEELDGLLQSVANGVNSDVRTLNLLLIARENIAIMADSIYRTHIAPDKPPANAVEAAYISYAFNDINSAIYFNPNTSAFQALKNSTYIGKLQGTDLALLINTYYSNAEKLRGIEEEINQNTRNLVQDWEADFTKQDIALFYRPFPAYDQSPAVRTRFYEILKDDQSINLLRNSTYEAALVGFYEEQILLGNKLIQMIKNSKETFDEQTKLEFSGILFSFGDADLVSLLINGQVPTEFNINYAASSNPTGLLSLENDYMVIEYPSDTYTWGAPYFRVNALKGRVHEMDFSPYDKLLIEMKGATGGEEFEVTMKDKKDPPDGSEARVRMQVTDEWKVYEIDTAEFTTADMKTIEVPLAFVFQGPEGQTIHVRSVRFKKG